MAITATGICYPVPIRKSDNHHIMIFTTCLSIWERRVRRLSDLYEGVRMKFRYLTLTLAASAASLHAQRVPTVGGQLQQIPPAPVTPRGDQGLLVVPPAKPAPADPAGARIRVAQLRVSGQTLYDEATLVRASGIATGSDLNLADLRAAAARIAAF